MLGDTLSFLCRADGSSKPFVGQGCPSKCIFSTPSLLACSTHQDGHVEGSSCFQGEEEAGVEVLRESQGEVGRAGAHQLRHAERHGTDWQGDCHPRHLESRLQGHGQGEKEFEVPWGT